ncbi:hypothetical protein QQX98_008945 [Neonectria punicea]|uniref:Protein-arginine deiminase C-terminal domain-containing protein n=1 Tax=Neonectria punicea TaxID=979145 RepID=A0ABR1GTZ0_9HYPO
MDEAERHCAKRIDANIAILKKEVGITNKDIFRIPTPFEASNFPVGAYFLGVVNNLVLNGHKTCVAPNPWGPVINGVDVLAKTIKAQYAKFGIDMKFVDDWNTHHNSGGEVHCGSNSARNMSARWW